MNINIVRTNKGAHLKLPTPLANVLKELGSVYKIKAIKSLRELCEYQGTGMSLLTAKETIEYLCNTDTADIHKSDDGRWVFVPLSILGYANACKEQLLPMSRNEAVTYLTTVKFDAIYSDQMKGN